MDGLQAPSLADDPRTVVAVAIPDSQLDGEEHEVYVLQRLPVNQPQEDKDQNQVATSHLWHGILLR